MSTTSVSPAGYTGSAAEEAGTKAAAACRAPASTPRHRRTDRQTGWQHGKTDKQTACGCVQSACVSGRAGRTGNCHATLAAQRLGADIIRGEASSSRLPPRGNPGALGRGQARPRSRPGTRGTEQPWPWVPAARLRGLHGTRGTRRNRPCLGPTRPRRCVVSGQPAEVWGIDRAGYGA